MVNVGTVLQNLLAKGAPFSSSDVATRAGVSRRAVHRHLQRWVASGELVAIGEGRARRYQAPPGWIRTFVPAGLEEDAVWRSLELSIERPVRDIVQYAFTEMLNNAIDHARATAITVRVEATSNRTAFEITDDGIGAWETVRRAHRLCDGARSRAGAVEGQGDGDAPTTHR